MFTFKSRKKLIEFLEIELPITTVVTDSVVGNALNRSVVSERTGLVKGYGVKSDLSKYSWFKYPEEVILGNKFGLPAPNRIYRIYDTVGAHLVIGMHNLCKKYNYLPKKSLNNITLDEINQFLNDSTICIKRLNTPIKI